MTTHDAVNPPLIIAAFYSPVWIHQLQDFWAVVLPIGGAILVVLQIVYYWNKTFGRK